MTDQLSWSTVGEWLAGFAPEGPQRTAVLLLYALCVAIAPFIYRYYLGVLAQGAQPEGSIERQDYDKLRASLAGGNLVARLYAKWLTTFLDGVERFFGDAGMADRTLFPHAFGLKTPATLWTAPAFDRCLFLAMMYPIWTVFLIWAISGNVGPAEQALNLLPHQSALSRGLIATGSIMFASFTMWRGLREPGWKSLVFIYGAAAVVDAVAIIIYATFVHPGALLFRWIVTELWRGRGRWCWCCRYRCCSRCRWRVSPRRCACSSSGQYCNLRCFCWRLSFPQLCSLPLSLSLALPLSCS